MGKRCSKCHELKSRDKFYKQLASKDGLHRWCKNCCQTYKQSDQGKAAQKKYHQSPKGKAANARYERSDRAKINKAKANKNRYNTIKGYLNRIFCGMRSRCDNPNTAGYENYGGKGVECRFEDANDFICYVMGVMGFNSYDKIKGLEIHRTKKHYEIGNIEFLTKAGHRTRHAEMRRQNEALTPPKPTEINDDRMRCGQRKSRTVAEINRNIKFQAEMDRKNLNPIIE